MARESSERRNARDCAGVHSRLAATPEIAHFVLARERRFLRGWHEIAPGRLPSTPARTFKIDAHGPYNIPRVDPDAY